MGFSAQKKKMLTFVLEINKIKINDNLNLISRNEIRITKKKKKLNIIYISIIYTYYYRRSDFFSTNI